MSNSNILLTISYSYICISIKTINTLYNFINCLKPVKIKYEIGNIIGVLKVYTYAIIMVALFLFYSHEIAI